MIKNSMLWLLSWIGSTLIDCSHSLGCSVSQASIIHQHSIDRSSQLCGYQTITMQRQRSVWLMLQRAVHSQPLIFVRAYARMQHLVPRSTLIKQHEQLEQQAHVIEHEPQPQATAPQTPSPAAPAAAPITPTTTTTTTTSQPQQQQQQQPLEKRRVVVSVPIEHQRFLRVGVVGPANAGKSSLVNSLVRSKISASSHKSQTTRTEVSGFLVEGNVQIEFVDTPGFVRAHALKKPDVDHTMAQVPWNVIETANTRLGTPTLQSSMQCDNSIRVVWTIV